MTVEIIEAKIQEDEFGVIWMCILEVSRDAEVYLLSATAPGTLLEADLQAHFEEKEVKLFATAQKKGKLADNIYGVVPEKILKAFALVVLDEINLLRSRHGLTERTAAQLRMAIKNKLRMKGN